jgi:hypothetical protein
MAARRLTLSFPEKSARRKRVDVPRSVEKRSTPITDSLTGVLPSNIDENAILEKAILEEYDLRPRRRR